MADDDPRFGFRLPPVHLPSFFPEDFELVFPVPGRVRGRPLDTRWVLVFAIFIDVLDAVLALTVTGPVLAGRSFVVFVLAVVVAKVLGLMAIWEVLAVMMGATMATIAPSVTLLVIARALQDR